MLKYLKVYNNILSRKALKIIVRHKSFILIFSTIAIICAVITYFFITRTGGACAEIYSDGKLLYTINLNDVSSPYEIPIEYGGKSNTVYIEKDCISVSAANCPDKLCIKSGKIKNNSYPIVCLPNKLVIKITDNVSLPDAVSR